MKKRNTAKLVFKVLFIVMLVITVLCAAVYIPIKMSIETANSNNTAPELFGTKFVPMDQNGKIRDISAGSLVLFEDMTASSVNEGVVLLYHKTSDSPNKMYRDLCMGSLGRIDETAEDGSITYCIITDRDTLDYEEISADSILGVGNYTMPGMASLFYFFDSNTSMLVMLVLPAGLFIIFLAVYLILRFTGKKEEEAYEDALKAPVKAEPLFDAATSAQIKSETVSSAATPLTSPIYEPDTPQSIQDTMPLTQTGQQMEDNTMPIDSNSLLNETAPESEQFQLDMALDDELGAAELEDQTPQGDGSDMTMEFDLADLQEELLEPEESLDYHFEESDPKAEILGGLDKELSEMSFPEDSVMFMLNEESIDVSFKNVISSEIDIVNHPDGSGFKIVTPNYEADIAVQVKSKQK